MAAIAFMSSFILAQFKQELLILPKLKKKQLYGGLIMKGLPRLAALLVDIVDLL